METKVLKEVLVEDKATKDGKNGEFFEFKLGGRTFRWFAKVEEEREIARSIKKGDVINATYTETTKGEYTYKNITGMTKLEGVTTPRPSINPAEYGMVFNNTVRVILEGDNAKNLKESFDEVFDTLMELNLKKRKELNV